MQSFRKCENLEKLDLSDNNFDDAATGSLIEAVVQWNNLSMKTFKYDHKNSVILNTPADYLNLQLNN